MNHHQEPAVVLLAETRLIPEGVAQFKHALGVPDWTTIAHSDAEQLIEMGGKLCYLSFSTDLNKNLTKTGTRNNFDYLQEGIIKTKHGSVLEHATVTFVLFDVSRVLTHELVRHRAGTAVSQVSGRYVRTDEVKAYYPSAIQANQRAVEIFNRAFDQMETNVKDLEQLFMIDKMTEPSQFSAKKILTSAFRRIIGNGQTNHIMFTANHRALRHIISMRTHRSAEEEIRKVFSLIFSMLVIRYPALYGDAVVEIVDGLPEVRFDYEKV